MTTGTINRSSKQQPLDPVAGMVKTVQRRDKVVTPAATSNNHQMVQLRLDVSSNEHESDDKRGNSARDLESNQLKEPYIKVEQDQLASKLGFLRTQTKLLESADS